MDPRFRESRVSQGKDNLTADAQDRVRIGWTGQGKIKTVTKTVRTVNLQTGVATVTSTYYVRAAQGNVHSLYDNNNRVVRQSEPHLYGSSRPGLSKPARQTPRPGLWRPCPPCLSGWRP